MVVTCQDDVEGVALEQPAVNLAVGMHHGDDELGASGADLLGLGDGGIVGRKKLKRAAGARFRRAVFGGEADKANLDAADVADFHVLEAVNGFAIGGAQIGGKQREGRLLHALHENSGAEIKLVITGSENVGRRHVGEGDGMFALVETRKQGWRDQVAGVGIDDVAALGALGLYHGIETGKAAALGRIVDFVDVANQQEGDVHAVSKGGRYKSRAGEKCRNQSVLDHLHWGLHRLDFG